MAANCSPILIYCDAQQRSGGSDDSVFPGPTGSRLSRDAVRRLVERHVATAIAVCPSLTAKVVLAAALNGAVAAEVCGDAAVVESGGGAGVSRG